MDFNQGWTFCKIGEETQTVNLPHDAMFAEKRDPYCPAGKQSGFFPGGVYLYTKEFVLAKSDIDKYIALFFEGVYQNCTVSVNGHVAGRHKYGFTEFTIEISQYVQTGKNLVVVHVDNSLQPNCRWYTGSGIYRPVSLIIKEKAHLTDVVINTISHNPAVISVQAHVNSESTAIVEIYDGESRVAIGSPGELQIDNAKLWSVDHPNLYTCIVKIDSDEVRICFGIRKLEWRADAGLLINGERVLLRGGCIHHDNGVLGACAFADAEERRIRILKEAGYNAIRSAHNPCSRAMLDACDRLGMLVMDEAFDGWYTPKNYHDYARWFYDEYQNDLRSMIQKDKNHPCVIMYSIGNEVSETAETIGGELCCNMANYVRSLDGTRPVTCGINVLLNVYAQRGVGIYRDEGNYRPELLPQRTHTKRFEKKTGSEFFNAMVQKLGSLMFFMSKGKKGDRATKLAAPWLDVVGLNYASSRYVPDVATYPERLMVGAETMAIDLPYNWSCVKEYTAILGDFVWAAWDYLGEAGAGSWTYHSYPGLPLMGGGGTIDSTGKIGAECFFQQIVWGLTNHPFVGVRPINHSGETAEKAAWRFTDAVDSWNWRGYEGTKAVVEVYSNAYAVRLLINGKPLATKRVRDFRVVFKTEYQNGTLTAQALDEEGVFISESSLRTGSEETFIRAIPDKTVLNANGQDMCFLPIEFTDSDGNVKPTAEQPITIEIEGALHLQGFGNACYKTDERFDSLQHSAYQGRALAVFRAGCAEGSAKITVRSKNLSPVIVEVFIQQNNDEERL